MWYNQKSENNHNFKHGGKGTRLYNIWIGMKNRCLNLNNKSYKDYGGRGITICDEWLDFIPFRDWSLNNGYQEHLTIDRKENNLSYNPDNCQWILNNENSKKKRTTKITLEKANEIRFKYNSGYYTRKQLSKEYTLHITTIHDIINNNIWKNT